MRLRTTVTTQTSMTYSQDEIVVMLREHNKEWGMMQIPADAKFDFALTLSDNIELVISWENKQYNNKEPE
jgi:hypothetical protein